MKENYISENYFNWYNHCGDTLLVTYNAYASMKKNPLFVIDDILKSFDNYIASLTICAIQKYKDITIQELNLLRMHLRFSPFYSKVESVDVVSKIIQTAKNNISQVPLYFEMSASIDKELEKNLIGYDVSLSGIFYNDLFSLLKEYFKLNEQDVEELISPINNFFIQKKIHKEVK